MNSSSLFSSSGPSARFLVIQLARFGDLVQTKRLVRTLGCRGQVELMVDRSLTTLAGLLYPEAIVHGVPAHGKYRADIGLLIAHDFRRVWDRHFDRVYNLNFSGLNFALSAMFESERVRGYRLRKGQRLIDFWSGQLMRWTRNRVETGVNLVDGWGLYADHPMDAALVNPEAVPRGRGLGVVMAGQNARRSLPPRLLAPFVVAARNRVNCGPIYFLGAGNEGRAARELASLLPPALRAEVRDLVGKTGWAELFDVVGGLELLLTPDTGSAHLAAHLGVPVLAFFLSSAWCHETGPYGAGHLVLQATAQCAPCLESAPCPHEIRCREAFASTEVLRYVSGRLDRQLSGDVAAMASGFDFLGLVYSSVSGRDPYGARRTSFRKLAAGVAGLGGRGCDDADMAAHLLHERDWMLPRTRGACDE